MEESEIVRRVKEERINQGRRYLDYFTPMKRARVKETRTWATKDGPSYAFKFGRWKKI